MKTVNFEYAFSEPHTLTLSRPSASEKVVAEAMKEGLRFSGSFSGLKNAYPLAWSPFQADTRFFMNFSIEGKTTGLCNWYRHESGAPYLFAEAKKENVEILISAISCKTGVIIKTQLKNSSKKSKKIHIQMAHTNGWVISNRGWIDKVNTNLLLTSNMGRADRILVYAIGADDYPMYRDNENKDEVQAPMSDEELGIRHNSMKKITAFYELKSQESKVGYFILPHKMYFEELDKLVNLDFEKEQIAASKEWQCLLRRGTKIEIEDKDLMSCYHACLADIFVMREKIGKYTGICCGTGVYRSPNSTEPLEAEILLDTLGYTKEAQKDYKMYLEGQDEDGCWVTRKGWENEGWLFIFNKANAVMEHYYITGDIEFLKENYKRMYASSMFNYKARCSTKNSEVKSERGLMPNGMGDSGMMNGSDYYGVFYPHNCLAVAADGKTLEAAKILGKTEDIELLTKIYEEAKCALLTSMKENLVKDGEYTIIPAVANKPLTSTFGALFSFFPGNLVKKDEPMILDMVKYIENKKISEGGLPIGTGWQRDGIWVAMALGSLARTYLRLGMYESAVKYLYPALNHASKFVTWCEERGAEKNAKKVSGDRHHLWTPLSVCQYLTDALFFEDENNVHICAGICKEWLSEGKKISVKGFKTHYGNTDFVVENIGGKFSVNIKAERKITKEIIVHLPNKNMILTDASNEQNTMMII